MALMCEINPICTVRYQQYIIMGIDNSLLHEINCLLGMKIMQVGCNELIYAYIILKHFNETAIKQILLLYNRCTIAHSQRCCMRTIRVAHHSTRHLTL